jgi:hypothetical protein
MNVPLPAFGASHDRTRSDTAPTTNKRHWEQPKTATRHSLLTDAALLLVPSTLLCVFIWERADYLINSDQLFTAALAWDLLHHADAWSGFQQPHSPAFVPELLIHWIVQALTGNWRVAMAAFVLVLVVWLMAIMTWIVGRIAGPFDNGGRTAATLAVVLIASPVLIIAVLGQSGSNDHGSVLFPWLFFTQPNSHGGTFLLGLTAAAIASRSVQRSTAAGPLCVLLIACVASASDQLFLIFFLLPVTAALLGVALVHPPQRRNVACLLAGAWAGAAFGAVCTTGIDRQYMPTPTPASMLEHVSRFLTNLPHHPAVLIAIVGLTSALAIGVRRQGPRLWLAGFWPLFAAGSAAASVALTMIMYGDVGTFRYMHPLLWWTVILMAAAVAPRLGEVTGRVRASYLVAVCIAGGLLLSGPAAGWHVPRLLTWTSPLATCLRGAGLRAGLAEYWTARLTSAASDWDLQVDQIESSGNAMIWGNDRLWFIHDIHDVARRPDYRFIVIDGLPEDRITALYGHPDRKMPCASATVWVYDQPGRVYQDLVRASPHQKALFDAAPPAF